MADATKIGDDVMASLRRAVTIVGPIPGGDLGKIKTQVNNLQGTLRNYDRHASSLMASQPTPAEKKEELNEVIKSRYPTGKGYTDKMYKMMVLRTMHRVMPFLNRKNLTKEQKIRASVDALTIFKLLSNVVLSLSKRLIGLSVGQEGQGQEDLQPEEFDPELSSTTQELERELSPSAATDQHQQQTETNVNRRTRRVQPTGKVESEDEYRTLVAKHSQVVEDARTSVRRHRDDVIQVLRASDQGAFRLVSNSARAMNELAKAYATAATNSRAELAPGSYSSCKAFADALGEITRLVIDSSAGNRQSRGMERKRNQEMDKYLSTTTVPKEEG